MLTLFAICVAAKLNIILDWMVSISSILLLLINILIFTINAHIQKKNQEFTDLQLSLQKEYDSTKYYKMLLEQTESQNILIHDIKQHLQSILLLNETQQNDKIENYITHIIHSSNLRNSKKICDNEMLNMILNRYQQQCIENSIAFSADVRSNTVNYLDEEDLTALFSNLLENALEAARQLKNGFIEMKIDTLPDIPCTIITLTNSCHKTPFIGNILPTQKSNKSHHGFGLKSIRRIVDKYAGSIKMYYEADTLTFHTIITINGRRMI